MVSKQLFCFFKLLTNSLSYPHPIPLFHDTLQVLQQLCPIMHHHIKIPSPSPRLYIPSTDQQTDTPTKDATNTDTQMNEAFQLQKLYKSYGASPGPSTAMYNIILDVISISILHLPPSTATTWLTKAHALSDRTIEQHRLDVSVGMDKVNLDSIPRPLTFNAIIRSAADALYDGSYDKLRDIALSVSEFGDL